MLQKQTRFEIKTQLRMGDRQPDVARLFNVSPSTISRIARSMNKKNKKQVNISFDKPTVTGFVKTAKIKPSKSNLLENPRIMAWVKNAYAESQAKEIAQEYLIKSLANRTSILSHKLENLEVDYYGDKSDRRISIAIFTIVGYLVIFTVGTLIAISSIWKAII